MKAARAVGERVRRLCREEFAQSRLYQKISHEIKFPRRRVRTGGQNRLP
jgi:hypothetical protein